MAVTGSRRMAVSLYSSHDLMAAHRSTVLTDGDKINLKNAISECMLECNVDQKCIDLEDFIKSNGIDAWGKLFKVSNYSPHVVQAWSSWRSDMDDDWPDTSDINLKSTSLTPTRASAAKSKWSCSEESGGKCHGTINRASDLKCRICGVPAKGWKCNYCSTHNKVWSRDCITCFVERADSEELLLAQIRETKRLEEEKEQERQRLLEEEAEMLALKKSEESNIPQGRFLHPGSFNMCGGNPSGFARCDGNGKCSVGPNSCQGCGAGTHWTCCFSDDPDSLYCTEGLSLDQATQHAKILADFSEVRCRVCDIPGLAIAGASLDWSCPACTSFNLMSRTSCEVCGSAAPEGVLRAMHDKNEGVGGRGGRRGRGAGRSSTGSDRKEETIAEVAPKKFQATLSETLQKLSSTLESEEQSSSAVYEGSVYVDGGRKLTNADDVGRSSSYDSYDDDNDNVFINDIYDYNDCDDDNIFYDDDIAADGKANNLSSTTVNDDVAKQNFIPENCELDMNIALSENYFHSSIPILSADSKSYESDTESDTLAAPPAINRFTSTAFFNLSSFEQLPDIDALCHFKDKNGNTAGHHAAYIGLQRTFAALMKIGASKWVENTLGDTPSCLRDGFELGSGPAISKLHKILTKRQFISAELLPIALHTPLDYEPSVSALPLLDALLAGEDEYDAAYMVNEAIADNIPHAKLYRAVFSMRFQYGPLQAKKDLQEYESEIAAGTNGSELDPLYYYVRLKLWFSSNGKMTSYAKRDRLDAYDALCAFRCYHIAEKWLDEEESFDEEVRKSGIDTDDALPEMLDDDYSDFFPPLGPDDPETLWENAKAEYGLDSPAMDALMKLTGLKAVKHKAKDVCLTVLLDPPKDLMTGTSCNFTFIGNPGTGNLKAFFSSSLF